VVCAYGWMIDGSGDIPRDVFTKHRNFGIALHITKTIRITIYIITRTVRLVACSFQSRKWFEED
jgi:hypothetical protein